MLSIEIFGVKATFDVQVFWSVFAGDGRLVLWFSTKLKGCLLVKNKVCGFSRVLQHFALLIAVANLRDQGLGCQQLADEAELELAFSIFIQPMPAIFRRAENSLQQLGGRCCFVVYQTICFLSMKSVSIPTSEEKKSWRSRA